MPDMNTLPGTNILYGAEISYFTGKVRAYFRWKEIPFREEAATREVYQNVILPRVGWPVVPVVVTPEDETLQDTTDIIDHFEARAPGPSIYPQGPAQRLAALLLECYGDEWLKIPAMHYRWNYNEEELLFEFGKLSAPDASEAEQREIGAKRAGPFRGALPVLGVTPETRAAIETSYEGLLGELERHFAAHPYLFGDRPSIGDFGLIGPLYAHNYRDPKSGAMMRALAPKVARWVERMMNPPAPRRGGFSAGRRSARHAAPGAGPHDARISARPAAHRRGAERLGGGQGTGNGGAPRPWHACLRAGGGNRRTRHLHLRSVDAAAPARLSGFP